jgi:mono/diheme cytochrome c family protein
MRKTVGIGAAVLLCAVAAAQAGNEDELVRIGQGRVFFITNCVSCHGPLGEGTRVGTDGLARGRTNLTRIAERSDGRFDELHVFHIIYGIHEVPGASAREMPIWGRVLAQYQWRGDEWARATCSDLVAYVRSIQTLPQAATDR